MHTASSNLRIGGFEQLSAVDWPGQLTAVVFCQGCAWRCRYCHNPHLISFSSPGKFEWSAIRAWLHRRRGLLDGIVFSGGEPTLQFGLFGAIREARALGYQIGLHTAGPSPAILDRLIPLLNWVGFDLKAPFADYERVTGRAHGERARASLRLLRSSRIPFEVRTTWHPSLLSAADLSSMARSVAEAGCTEWVIQRFRPEGCADEQLRAAPAGTVPLDQIQAPGLAVSVR